MEEQFDFIQSQSKDSTFGNLAELLLPSGHTVVIREQNGNDDDVLSSFSKDDLDSNAINRFVAGIIIKNNYSWAKTESRLNDKDILKLPLRDKYFIIMASRIFSLGHILKFTWDWKDDNHPIDYEQDLSEFMWDYKKPFPTTPEDPGFFKEMIKPYNGELKESSVRTFTLRSGKEIQYNLLNGIGENYLLKLPLEKRTVNAGLKARKLKLYVEGSWQEVVNFSSFTPKDMSDIRNDLDKYDSQFEGLIQVENPNSGQVIDLPLMNIPDFFFPREI